MYKTLFEKSNLTYVDVAHELGCCELTARNKINGKTKITKAEANVLDKLFGKGENEVCLKNTTEGVDATCTISRHNR